jgi:hypothetical protein
MMGASVPLAPRGLLPLFTLLLVAQAAPPGRGFAPPLYNITAGSLFDAGKQQGTLAGARIRGWFAGQEMTRVIGFAQGDPEGKVAYSQLRNDSATMFPQYADELRGIAEGSGVPLDQIWAGILMIELLNLMGSRGLANATELADHCSDISAVAAVGFIGGFAHGHNEDWDPEAGEHYYYVKLTPAGAGADFASCAGLAYPGALIGWAPTWNAKGVFFSVNTLVPRKIKRSGVSTSFIQREAICGVGKGATLAEVVKGLENRDWADGASINLLDTKGALGNLETYEETHSFLGVTALMGNSSHFNAYKRITPRPDGQPRHSSVVRQARADALPPPRSAADVVAILSNTADGREFSILRDITIATLLLDGGSGRLEAWGGTAPASTPPIHSWNLSTFWGESTA